MSTLATTTTILITGANRGIGRALVETYLLRPSHTVIAAVRTISTAEVLHTLRHDLSTSLLVVRIDNVDLSSPAAAVTKLQITHSINKLDIVIANAGISKVYPRAADASIADLREHFEVNTLGPLALFQACRPLLEKSEQGKFLAVSSSAASIGGMKLRPPPNSVYGPSKAALNYLIRKIHFEHEDLIVFPIDPGWVQTEMGNRAAVGFGLDKAETTVEDSVAGIVNIVENATREKTSGKFALFSGGEWPW